jgi:putative ABC transport system permease protein
MRRLMNVEYYSGLLLEMDRPDRADEAATTVANILRQRHHRLANLPDDFQIQNERVLVETQLASSNRLSFYVRWIALSGLFVSALGILVVCWIAVKGRTVEIGTRRALGANALDVFLQIVLEAAVICSAGCALGLAIGWQASHLLAQRANLPFVFDAANARLAIVVSVAMNFTFAILSATRAAKVSPISALKYE